MAAKLQCEICGGKLIGRPGGIFECDSCGMEYSTEWAKQKIQEITGTVRIEGPVEVQGTVKVESGEKTALLQRGMMALEEEKWDQAKKFFDQALNYDAKCAEAYLGLAMVEGTCKDKEMFLKAYLNPYTDFNMNTNIQRAIKFASDMEAEYYNSLIQKRREKINSSRDKDRKCAERILTLSRQSLLWRNMLHTCYCGKGICIFGIKTDGRVLSCYSDEQDELREISQWKNIKSISSGMRHVLGLRMDGSVVAVGDNTFGQCNVSSWKDITAVKASYYTSLGIRADGTVIAIGRDINGQCEVEGFHNIIDTILLEDFRNGLNSHDVTIIGLRKDGTIALFGDKYGDFQGLNKWKGIKTMWPIWISSVPVLVGVMEDNIEYCVPESMKDQWIDSIKPGDKPIDYIDFSDYLKLGVGLFADGKVRSSDGTVIMDDVTEICGDYSHYFGLHSNGSVTECCKNSREGDVYKRVINCTDAISIKSIGRNGTICVLRKNGTIWTNDTEKEKELSTWKLFDYYEKIEAERKETAERAVTERRNIIENLTGEKRALQAEVANLNGLFTGKRRKEIQSRITKIETTLDTLKQEEEEQNRLKL